MRLADTHAELARIHARLRAEGPALARVDGEQPLPLSAVQQRMWFAHELDPDSAALNIHYAVRLVGALAVEPLRRALELIIERHEPLRTVYVRSAGVAAQVVLPASRWQLPVIDIAHLGDEARAAELRRLDREQALARFDLGVGPVVRNLLLRLGAAEHVLLLTMHHIASDGWSMGVLWNELVTVYQQVEQGEPIALPRLPIRYADFAAWQQRYLSGDELVRRIEWWKQNLAGVATDAGLPVDRSGRSGAARRSADVDRVIGVELRERLQALGAANGGTLFSTLLAALRVVLARYTGERDLCIATPVASRHRAELRALVGCFVNTLAVRSPIDPDQSFGDVVARESRHFLDAYAHHETQYDAVVDALGLRRERGRPPLCQVMFNHLGGRMVDGTLAFERLGLKVERLRFGMNAVDFDLALTARECPHGLELVFGYDADRFDADTIDRLASHFVSLLEAVCAEPDRPVAAIPLMTDAERQRLLIDWNGHADAGGEAGFVDRFEQWVDRTPHAIAVVDDRATASYHELDARANRLARWLIDRGVGPEVPVAVVADRSIHAIAAILGVLKAGGAYVPIDPRSPPDRVAFLFEHSGAKLAVTTQAHDRVPPGIEQVTIDGVPDAGSAAERPRRRFGPQNLAYIMYTSGSTGRPKGVAVEHRQLASYVEGMIDRLEVEPGWSHATVSTIAADLGNTSILGALCTGGCLHVIGEDRLLDPEAMAETMARFDIDCLKIVPSHLRALTSWVDPVRLLPRRRLILGGEASAPEWLADLERRGRCRIFNHYGPTETTIGVVAGEVPAAERLLTLASVPLGTPMATGRVYCLDDDLEPVPVGVWGELCIGGGHVARGYLGRPDLTAERFVPDPHAQAPGQRLYRSGDRVRWRADGTLEFRGRLDDQVKIRGFRIEPEEIRRTLLALPDVKEAAVVAQETGADDHRLIAYAVPAHEQVTADTLREQLARRLPEYMMPAAFVFLPALPLTHNGKLDRHALPIPAADPIGAVVSADARDPTEEIVAGIWSEVLGLDRIGIRDDFFALGGHSLLATQVVSRVRTVFGVELSLRRLFEAPTVEGQAREVTALRGHGPGAAPIVPVPRGGELVCSFGQRRLWFLHQLEPNSPTYHQRAPRRLLGRLDVDVLGRALNALIERHESLRTVFPATGGIPRQHILEPTGIELPIDDVSHLSAEQRDAAVQQRISAELDDPFDLARGPLLRARLIRLCPDDHVLVLAMHHIISDGWSMRVLWRELMALYTALVRGDEPRLPPLPVQYADYAAWQRGSLAGATPEQHLEYWERRLAGAPVELALPLRGPRPPVLGHRGEMVAFDLGLELSRQVADLGRRAGATSFMTLLAGFRALLARYTGHRDVCIGTPIANRHRAEIEGVIGFFVNTLVLRTEMSGDDGFATLLSREKQNALDAYAHQDTPFELIVDRLGVERSLSRTPVFQVMFGHDDEFVDDGRYDDLRLQRLDITFQTAKFDLTVATRSQGGLVRVNVVYNTDLFDRPMIEQMARHYATLLRAVCADPDRPLSSIRLLDDGEWQRVVYDWNATARGFESGLVHERIEAQVDRTPTAIAVSFEGQAVTYRELDQRANWLAHQLRRSGLRCDEPAGVLLDRSIDMVVSVLGILKAGAAFMPIDPGYPSGRVRAILDDSRARFVVGHSKWAHLIDSSGVEPIWLDRESRRPDDPAPTRLRVTVDPDGLAYVLFTSGSTGRPKGVMNRHRSLMNRLLWMQDAFTMTGCDAVVQKTPFTFDVSVWEFFWPLMTGARLVMARPGEHRDPAYLAELLRTENVTTLHFVPSMLATFVDSVDESAWRSVRRVICSGEALSPQLVAAYFSQSSAELVNLYGPTEAAIDVSIWRCRETDATVPIGHPVANTQLHVLDPHMSPVPIGVPGELHIGGVQLARGYLGRPDLTAERFVPDPFGPPGSRLYRTGDRARWRRDGTIEFLGRLDDQVKLRGFRIELGEIENALLQHATVQQCAVVARVVGPSQQLVAYVVPAAAARDISGLRAHTASWLPDYMVPAVFVGLDAFPVTASGKVDRSALPAPDASGYERTDYVEPRSPAEAMLAAIWVDVLGVDQVGVHDDFFSLGGHSLLATQLMSRIAQQFGAELPLRALFEAPTVEGLARQLAHNPAFEVAQTGAPGGLRRGRASTIQDRWYRVRQANLSIANCPPFRSTQDYTLTGALEVDLLVDSFAALVRRHWMLRAALIPGDDGIVQTVIEPPASTALAVHELGQAADRDIRAEQIFRALVDTPHDLAAGEMFRASLLRFDDQHHRLILTSDHLVQDGTSHGIVLSDLVAIYSALHADRRADPDAVLSGLGHQYIDWAEHQWRLLDGQHGAALRDYWTGRLAGASELILPIDPPIAASDKISPLVGSREPLAHGPLRQLSAFVGRERLTRPSAFLAVLFAWLHRRTGQTDLCVAVPADARSSEFSRVVGHFTLPLIVRARIDGGMRFSDLCHTAQSALLDAFEWRHAPLYSVISPPLGLWRIAFNYRRQRTAPRVVANGLTIAATANPYRPRKSFIDMDLQFHLVESETGAVVIGLNGRDRSGVDSVRELRAEFSALAERLFASPDERIA